MADLFTAQDALEHLSDVFEFTLTEEDRLLRSGRRAIYECHRDLPNVTRWRYFQRSYTFDSDADYETGTVAYDHTGGTYEREVTLTDGTWPDNAAAGTVIISGKHYKIDRRISDTVVTLKENNNPGSDVTAGTSFTYYRDQYDVPEDWRKVGLIFDTENEMSLGELNHEDQVGVGTVYYDTPDTPWHFTIRGSDNTDGRLAIVLTPPPSSARQYRVTYEAAMRPIKLFKYATGTVTTSGTTVTLSGGTFPTSVRYGTQIRFSDSATAVTGLFGGNDDTSNPYYAQRMVVARNSDTEIVINTALDSNQTSVAYEVSDPIDLEPGAMMSAFLRGIERSHATNTVLDARNVFEQKYRQAVRSAMEADQRATYASRHVGYDPFSRVSISTDSG